MLWGVVDTLRDLGLQVQASAQHYQEAAVTAIPGIIQSRIFQLLLTAALSSAISYVTLLSRLEERQVAIIHNDAEMSRRLERIDEVARSNAATNKQQDTVIQLRLDQCGKSYSELKSRIVDLEKEMRSHEADDREQFRKKLRRGGKYYDEGKGKNSEPSAGHVKT